MRVSAFAERVYEVVRRVPAGRVTTYGLVARAVGCGSARAVGQALRRNPYAPDVPCHRVIRSDLRVGGFCGSEEGVEVRRKLALLAREGVLFRRGKLIETERVVGRDWSTGSEIDRKEDMVRKNLSARGR